MPLCKTAKMVSLAVLFCAQLMAKEQTLPVLGVGVVYSGKLLVTATLQSRITERLYWRTQLYVAWSGSPSGVRSAPVIFYARHAQWQPSISPGLDMLFAREKTKIHPHPFVSLQAGVLCRVNEDIAYEGHLWSGYFYKSNRLRPLGMGLVHFNRLR